MKTAKMKYTFVNQIVPGLPKGQYYYGKPTSVVLHDTGNDSSTIDGEVSYMSRSWGNAFVHGWANADKVIETADTDYPCWGAGPAINNFAVQIELVHEHTKERFLKSIDRWIFWAAYQCYWYDIVPNDATQDGNGTIWTHEAVSIHLGRTDHVDPMPYIRSRGADFGLNITWQMLYNKLVEYYQALVKGDSTGVKMIGGSEPVRTATVDRTATVKTVAYDKAKYRKRSLDAYVKGIVDADGAAVRKRTGNSKTGFKFDKSAGYSLKPGSEVYIFETHKGWGRIYTGASTGKGSNEWIWLGRLQVTKVYK